MDQLEVMSLAYGTRLSVIDKQGIEHNILQGFYINSSDNSLLDNDDVSTEQDSLDVDYDDSDDSNKSTHSMVENHELYVAPNSPHSEARSELCDDMDILDILMDDVPQMSPHSEPRSGPSHMAANSPLRMYDVQNSSRHDISPYSTQSDLSSASGNKSEDLPLNGALPHDSPHVSPPCID